MKLTIKYDDDISITVDAVNDKTVIKISEHFRERGDSPKFRSRNLETSIQYDGYPNLVNDTVGMLERFVEKYRMGEINE